MRRVFYEKVSKIILASSLVLGFSVTPELFNVTQAHAQESVKPYYNYSGYTAYQSRFILDKILKIFKIRYFQD